MTKNLVKLEDYVEMASTLYQNGQMEESLAVLTDASQRHWPPLERGILLSHLAQFHSNVIRKHDDALGFAFQAVSVLSTQPGNTESDLALIDAESLVAHLLWDVDRLRASTAASDALRRTERLIVAHQDDPDTLWELHYAACRLQVLSNEWEKAIESARRALASAAQEDRRFALIELGNSLRMVGKYVEARSVFNEVLAPVTPDALGPPNPRIYAELALIEDALGNRDQARLHIETAIELVRHDADMRSDPGIYEGLCRTLRELGELSMEARLYRELIGHLKQEDEIVWAIRLSLGRCEVELLHFETALELFHLIQEWAPIRELRETAGRDIIDVQYRVAFRDYEDGHYEKSIKKSVALLPFSESDPELRADLFIMLGNGYARLGKYLEARSFYQQVMASCSARSDQRDHAKRSLQILAHV